MSNIPILSNYYSCSYNLGNIGVIKRREIMTKQEEFDKAYQNGGFKTVNIRQKKFYYSCINGEVETVKRLLQDKWVDPAYDNNLAIRWAASNGQVETTKLLLKDKRVDPASDGSGALRYASVRGKTDIVKLLLEDGRVDPTAYDSEAINIASRYGNKDIVELLEQAIKERSND